MPEKTSAPRWATKDGPMLQQAIQKAIPNAQIDNDNANGDSNLQYQQAQNDLNKGDCILVVAASDSVAAADIVSMAKDRGVPVIAYDRLIQSKDTSYYVSFDGVAVGKLQGEYIAQHYTQYAAQDGIANIAMINGSQTDTNALLFSEGVHEILDPLFKNGTFKLKAEVYTPAWNPNSAKVEMETILTQNPNNIQIVYVANDGMAAQAINALRYQNINGSVLVTGQDATTDAIRNLINGDQSMTVYKPTSAEAQSTADLIKAIFNGTDTHVLTNGHTVNTNDGGTVPAVLDQPIMVDRTNIASTVLKDNFVTKADICKGLAQGSGGIC
jgi:D-xylose transport system substrate-binding protein